MAMNCTLNKEKLPLMAPCDFILVVVPGDRFVIEFDFDLRIVHFINENFPKTFIFSTARPDARYILKAGFTLGHTDGQEVLASSMPTF